MKIKHLLIFLLSICVTFPLSAKGEQRTIKRKVAIGRFSNERSMRKDFSTTRIMIL